MLKIEKKSIRVIYTSFWKCISFRKFPPRGTFHSIESFHDSLYIYIYIVCKLEEKGNFKGNNRSIGFNLFEYQLRVKNEPILPPSPLVFHYQRIYRRSNFIRFIYKMISSSI